MVLSLFLSKTTIGPCSISSVAPQQMHSSLYSPRCLEALLFWLTLCRPPTSTDSTDCANSHRQRGCVISNWMQSQCRCALFKAASSSFLGCPSLTDVFCLCEIGVDSTSNSKSLHLCASLYTCPGIVLPLD